MTEVTVRSLANLQQQVVSRSHSFISDEPEDYDGDNLGPTPYELLVGALGSCMNITLLGYARRKGWPLTGIETRLSTESIHEEDCLRCQREELPALKIKRTIQLAGELTAEQVEILARVAKKCPVHKALTQGALVVDEVNFSDGKAR